MADKPKQKRLVRNPDTFRERAVKAGEAEAKVGRRGRLKQLLGSIFGPVGKGFRAIARWKPLAPLLKVLRFIGKIIFPSYFRNSWRELKLVTWPNWKQSRQLTFAVLVFAIVFGAAIAVVDFGLDKLFKNILLK
ncbi:MAG TPA: preprotein translocase subunit SecE [Candidatus Saccharimonadales bacterium]|jgi:preprotein translocase SecE subunit|nr:preprotein translocase subunit SecE [Candidatus Saccharimonadales bacterium]